jgi:hypothetical protein
VVSASLAGLCAVEAARRASPPDRIVLIGDHLTYHRPRDIVGVRGFSARATWVIP